ncbi:hypothetical protein DDQ41_17720 [Streptomyces spongiicola]|uniref:Uncharacterized protein n=1 Tax=Streptomyces spongiicola TaxID=1690221 RepID=A0ABM6V8N1_9ACTN|nr:hypothetical protein DDQ41_17720 [Streptomyces spongiicola]
MLSAPATVPPTIDIAFASAAVPAPFFAPRSFTFRATRAGRPHRSASRVVGKGPACAIRLGSSNTANRVARLWETLTSEVPCRSCVVEA